jgi:hypothetical protein
VKGYERACCQTAWTSRRISGVTTAARPFSDPDALISRGRLAADLMT